ncbi:MAG: FAD-binding oxidoreductase [Cyanobacteria bacterium J06635_15]
MKTYDWIVVGNGLAGAAVGYELTHLGHDVLVLEQSEQSNSATRYSYGGVPYWAGTTEITRQLAAEGIERHRNLSEELGKSTEFRELDLLMPIDVGIDPVAIAQDYQKFAIPPQLISVAEACEIEPQLNADVIAGALIVGHGHVNPMAVVQAYNHAMVQQGGELKIAPVTGLVRIGDRVTGVTTPTQAYAAANVIIAAGAYSRQMMQAAGLPIKLYFTQAEMVRTPPVDFHLRSLVMPADLKRFDLEDQASSVEMDNCWDAPNAAQDILPPILDAGAIQLKDGSLCMGQISRVRPSLHSDVDAAQSEAQIRAINEAWMPILKGIPGTWHACPVSFSRDKLPLVGPIPKVTGVHLFTGFSSPFSLLPPIAARFARWVDGAEDEMIPQMRPDRFA